MISFEHNLVQLCKDVCPVSFAAYIIEIGKKNWILQLKHYMYKQMFCLTFQNQTYTYICQSLKTGTKNSLLNNCWY